MRYSVRLAIFFLITIAFSRCGKRGAELPVERDSTYLDYSVLNVIPHNPKAFTQGLVIYNNKIIESTGQNNSWIAEVNPGNGEHDKKVILDSKYFGEGITVFNKKIYQLTWKSSVGFVYDVNNYTKLKEFKYDKAIKEGWGITNDNENLIISDGTSKIHFVDTTDFKVNRTITITFQDKPVKQINELEYINGFIFANIWQTNWIIKIDPSTGKVVARLDLSSIGNEINSLYPNADVLNGIAYDKNSGALLITGKLWPRAYLIKIL